MQGDDTRNGDDGNKDCYHGTTHDGVAVRLRVVSEGDNIISILDRRRALDSVVVVGKNRCHLVEEERIMNVQ